MDQETYELHISHVQDVNLVGIYVVDITQLKRNEEEIRLLATTDSLTGLLNRREFTRILTSEIERTRRHETPLSLIMYDIDHFKRVNDTYGHDTGDHVLQAVSNVVTENVRITDRVALGRRGIYGVNASIESGCSEKLGGKASTGNRSISLR